MNRLSRANASRDALYGVALQALFDKFPRGLGYPGE